MNGATRASGLTFWVACVVTICMIIPLHHGQAAGAICHQAKRNTEWHVLVSLSDSKENVQVAICAHITFTIGFASCADTRRKISIVKRVAFRKHSAGSACQTETARAQHADKAVEGTGTDRTTRRSGPRTSSAPALQRLTEGATGRVGGGEPPPARPEGLDGPPS